MTPFQSATEKKISCNSTNQYSENYEHTGIQKVNTFFCISVYVYRNTDCTCRVGWYMPLSVSDYPCVSLGVMGITHTEKKLVKLTVFKNVRF